MEKEKKTYNFVNFIKTMITPQKPSIKDRKENHQPSWMYRNE